MRRRWKAVLFASCVGALAAVGVAAGAGGSQTAALYLGGDPYCDLNSYASTGTPSKSSATLRYSRARNEVSATVNLRHASANTMYSIRLIQGDPDCYTVDATVTTNNLGKATVSLAEPAVSTKAVIFVCGPSCGAEQYASEPVFSHP